MRNENLIELYQSLETSEEFGKNIVFPNSSREALFLSDNGELFCYTGTYNVNRVQFESWPYTIHGKHSNQCKKQIRGLFRIKSGSILLTGFVDHNFYRNRLYKQLNNYIVRLPVPNSTYFAIEKREMQGKSVIFIENEYLTRAAFGLTFTEIGYLINIYAERLGIKNDYFKYPRLTRSLKTDNFCDITNLWIPQGFPYVAFSESGCPYSHVSLYGFYQHIRALLSVGANTNASKIFEHQTFCKDIIRKVKQLDNYFPFEIPVSREYVRNWVCTVLSPEDA